MARTNEQLKAAAGGNEQEHYRLVPRDPAYTYNKAINSNNDKLTNGTHLVTRSPNDDIIHDLSTSTSADDLAKKSTGHDWFKGNTTNRAAGTGLLPHEKYNEESTEQIYQVPKQLAGRGDAIKLKTKSLPILSLYFPVKIYRMARVSVHCGDKHKLG